MKTTTKTITREYDDEGRLIKEVETTEEKICDENIKYVPWKPIENTGIIPHQWEGKGITSPQVDWLYRPYLITY